MTKSMQRTKHDLLIAALLALAGFALYAATAAPSVATLFDDSLEFQVVVPTLGIAHPSGYPLYTLLGKLATLLIPFRDAAGRLNLFSALCAAAAVGILYLVAAKLAGNRAAAAVATIAFAISPAWWSQATIAEVYALHGLLVALFLYCLLRWEEKGRQGRGGEGEKGRSDAWLSAAALVFGLGMAHHRMMALLLPAALVFIFWSDPALIRQPRRWRRPIGLGLAPLLLYLYLPLRGAQGITSLDGTYTATTGGTLDWILARGYSVFLTGNPFGVERGTSSYLALFLQQMGVLPLLAALMGLARTWRTSVRRSTLLLLATAAQVAFGMVYKVQDVEVFFIPAFLLIALWAAIGLAQFFDAATRQAVHAAQPLRLPVWARPVYLAACLLPVAGIVLFYPALEAVQTWSERDRSAAWGVYDYGRDMIDSAAPGGAVVGLLGETTLVRYCRDVLGQRPDLRVIPADAEAGALRGGRCGAGGGRPRLPDPRPARCGCTVQPGCGRAVDRSQPQGHARSCARRPRDGRGHRPGGRANTDPPDARRPGGAPGVDVGRDGACERGAQGFGAAAGCGRQRRGRRRPRPGPFHLPHHSLGSRRAGQRRLRSGRASRSTRRSL